MRAVQLQVRPDVAAIRRQQLIRQVQEVQPARSFWSLPRCLYLQQSKTSLAQVGTHICPPQMQKPVLRHVSAAAAHAGMLSDTHRQHAADAPSKQHCSTKTGCTPRQGFAQHGRGPKARLAAGLWYTAGRSPAP